MAKKLEKTDRETGVIGPDEYRDAEAVLEKRREKKQAKKEVEEKEMDDNAENQQITGTNR